MTMPWLKDRHLPTRLVGGDSVLRERHVLLGDCDLGSVTLDPATDTHLIIGMREGERGRERETERERERERD